MNTILNRFDRLMAAITFAEANEPEVAAEHLGRRKPERSTCTHEQTTNTQMTGGRILPNQTAH